MYSPLEITVFENHRKVAFNIASETRYIYILSRQKFIRNGQFGEFLKKLSLKSISIAKEKFEKIIKKKNLFIAAATIWKKIEKKLCKIYLIGPN